MQASLGAAHCAKSSSSTQNSNVAGGTISPTMYLVSPFYGVGGYATVFGNIGLVLLSVAVHMAMIVLGQRLSPRHQGDTGEVVEVLSWYRFPNVSIEIAVYAVQGVTLGGWGLLWNVINPDTPHDDEEGVWFVFASVVTWAISQCYPIALLIAFWQVRKVLLPPRGLPEPPRCSFLARFERYVCSRVLVRTRRSLRPSNDDDTIADAPLHAFRIPAELLPNLTLLRLLAPHSFWKPRHTRLMFGALFNSYRKEEVGLLWLGGDVLFLPTVVSIASTTKPSTALRSAVCNSVMLAAASLLMVYALALACARPYRVGARNVLSPLVVLWGAVTCVLSCPLVTESLGASATNNALGSVSTLQSTTVLFLAIANVVVFFTIDRVMTSLEWQDILSDKLQHLSAELLPLDDDNHLPLSLADKIIVKNDASITALNDYVVKDLFKDLQHDAAPDSMINGDDSFDSHFLNCFDASVTRSGQFTSATLSSTSSHSTTSEGRGGTKSESLSAVSTASMSTSLSPPSMTLSSTVSVTALSPSQWVCNVSGGAVLVQLTPPVAMVDDGGPVAFVVAAEPHDVVDRAGLVPLVTLTTNSIPRATRH